MAEVKHVLKDGTEVKDISGHVIKSSEFKTLYEIVNRINNQKERTMNETSNAWKTKNQTI